MILTLLSVRDVQALRLSGKPMRDFLNEAMFQFLWGCGCSTLHSKFEDPPLSVAALVPVCLEPTWFNICKNILAPSAELRLLEWILTCT